MMHIRCENPTHVGYHYYGGRGIKVCERWHKTNPDGFKNFVADMGPRPAGFTLDRIDPDGPYILAWNGKLQCRWASWEEQNNNKRFHKYARMGKEAAKKKALAAAQEKMNAQQKTQD